MSYTLYDVSWASGLIERAAGRINRQIEADDPDIAWLSEEFKVWCEQHLKLVPHVFVTYEIWNSKDGDIVYSIGNLYFEHDEDFIMFKMRWLNV